VVKSRRGSARFRADGILFTGRGFISELAKDPQHLADRSALITVGDGKGDPTGKQAKMQVRGPFGRATPYLDRCALPHR